GSAGLVCGPWPGRALPRNANLWRRVTAMAVRGRYGRTRTGLNCCRGYRGIATRYLPALAGRPQAGSLLDDEVLKNGHDLLRRLRPAHGGSVDLLQRMHDVGAVQSDIRATECRTIAGIESRIPLLVLFAEADHRHVAVLDHGLRANAIDAGGLMIAPEAVVRLAEHITGGITGIVIGNRRHEFDRQISVTCTLCDLLTPVGMDLAGQIDRPDPVRGCHVIHVSPRAMLWISYSTTRARSGECAPARPPTAAIAGTPRTTQHPLMPLMPTSFPGRYPAFRSRRTRATDFIRRMVRESRLTVDDLIYPLFVTEDETVDVPAMPGIRRHSPDDLVREATRAAELGIPAVVLFPVIDPSRKTIDAMEAANPEGLIPQAIRRLKTELPQLGVMTDVALDPYTSHGQDGVIDDDGNVLNDETVHL